MGVGVGVGLGVAVASGVGLGVLAAAWTGRPWGRLHRATRARQSPREIMSQVGGLVGGWSRLGR